ncbi:hypothetical protein GCM10010307_77660 [Streptomyces vastus]|uniref:Alpha/beta hydrolase n=1 Tax=Streptomyces vastus TaxID=285451 RepID=A0ABP6E563_9ACTN
MNGRMSELIPFTHTVGGERLSGLSSGTEPGEPAKATAVLLHGAGNGSKERLPDAAKLAGPWRELGRTDLTPEVLGGQLEAYVVGLLERYA